MKNLIQMTKACISVYFCVPLIGQ